MKLLTVFAAMFLMVHPLHVSVTEIAFDEKEKELEIIMRIFIDDLETSVRQARNEPTLNILEPGNATVDQVLKEYVMPRFRVSLDDKLQETNYLGHEIDGEAILCYIQVSKVKKWKTITVKNEIIMEMYDDQSNLVNITVNDVVRSLRLLKDKPSGKITFNK